MLAREAWMRALLYSWSKVSPQHSTVQEFQRLCHCRIQLLSPPVPPLATEQDVQTRKGRPANPEDSMAEGEKQLPQVVLRPPHVYHSKCRGGTFTTRKQAPCAALHPRRWSELCMRLWLGTTALSGCQRWFCEHSLSPDSAVLVGPPGCNPPCPAVWLADWMSVWELCSCICSAPWAVHGCASL